MLEVNIKKKLPGFTLDISFSVNNDTLAILGPSGSGKTLTLRCIAGLMRPDSGLIRLNGKTLYDSATRTNLSSRSRKIGFVFQNYALFPHLTACDNVAFGISDQPANEKQRIVDDLLDKMGLRDLSARYPRQLSAGQQQRIALARALAPKPDVLLLDEPFSALDTTTKEYLEPHVMAIRQFYEGSMLLVTHDVSEAYRLCSRIAVYESGKIVQCDDKGKLISSPTNLTSARLTGLKNLLHGTITETNDSNLWIKVPQLGTLKALLHERSCLSTGMEVTIGIRSEHIMITNGPGENNFCATVNNISEEMNGQHWFLQVSTSNNPQHNLEAVVPALGPGVSYLPNNQLYIHIPPQHIIVIKQEV